MDALTSRHAERLPVVRSLHKHPGPINAYSEGLRQKIVEAVRQGMPQTGVRKTLDRGRDFL